MIEYHPYDAHIDGMTNINQCNIVRIEEGLHDAESFRFAFITDTQRWYDETEDVVAAINQRTDLDFVIHGGDLTDFGTTKEFLWQRNILNGLKIPYVCLIGNHDCLPRSFISKLGSLGCGRDTRSLWSFTINVTCWSVSFIGKLVEKCQGLGVQCFGMD